MLIKTMVWYFGFLFQFKCSMHYLMSWSIVTTYPLVLYALLLEQVVIKVQVYPFVLRIQITNITFQNDKDTTYVIVIVQPLFDHIKLPVFSWVISYSSTIEPVSIVAADVMVHLTPKKDNSASNCSKKQRASTHSITHSKGFLPVNTQTTQRPVSSLSPSLWSKSWPHFDVLCWTWILSVQAPSCSHLQTAPQFSPLNNKPKIFHI